MKNRIIDYLPDSLKSKSTQPGGSQPSFSVPDMRQWIKTTEEFVGKHPGSCLGAAFVLGVTLAWWIKRK